MRTLNTTLYASYSIVRCFYQSLFETDIVTRNFLAEMGREKEFREVKADEDADYEKEMYFSAEIEPMVAKPHNVDNVVPVSDVEGVINGFLQEGVVKADEADEIRGKIRSFLENPESGKYFNPGLNVKTEAEILLPDGKTIRPDRIILEGPKATVIDFKTGGNGN